MNKQEFFEKVEEEEENIRDEMTLERLKKDELGEYLSVRAKVAADEERAFWENINPDHYKKGDLECIDVVAKLLSAEQFKGYLWGNIFKYSWRMFSKGSPRENTEKLIWYSQKMSELLK